MKGDISTGFDALAEGLRLARSPGIRPYVLIPLSINIILFGGFLAWGYGQVQSLNEQLLAWVPDWLDWLSWLVWPLFFLLALVFVMYGFSIIANLVASPFNGFLAEKVEIKLTGEPLPVPTTWQNLLLMVPRSIGRELKKLLYYLPLLLGTALLTLIPGINIAAPVLWFCLNAWMMNIQYLDYPMDNHLLSFNEVKNLSRQQRMTSLGFGGAVMLATMIPLVNLVIMPVAVCGATSLWVKSRYKAD